MKIYQSIIPVRRNVWQSQVLTIQRGSALITSLLMLLAVLMIGTSAAQISLQGEKASRNDRDRQIALQAAEAALADAEQDIEFSQRSHLFAVMQFDESDMQCGKQQSDIYRGICRWSDLEHVPGSHILNIEEVEFQSISAAYGDFTGKTMHTGSGMAPARLPRYLIEILPHRDGKDSNEGKSTHLFRITAIGFGMKENTQVALQTLYRRKEGDGSIALQGRLSWREILNWREFRNGTVEQ